MIILSIDPGIERTGCAIFKRKSSNDFSYVNSMYVTTSKKDTLQLRLKVLYDKLKEIVEKYKPDHIVLERLFFFKNETTVIPVAQAQGMILLLAGKHTIPVSFLTPPQIKETVTGYGKSDKKSVQKMLGLQLGLKEELKQDDVADAIACGYAYCCINEQLLS